MPRHLRQVSPASVINDPPAEYESTGFIKVSNEWFDWASDNLSDAEFRLVITLLKWTTDHPSMRMLSTQTKWSSSKVIRAIKSLERKKAIQVIRRGKGARNHYRILHLYPSSVIHDTPAQKSTGKTSTAHLGRCVTSGTESSVTRDTLLTDNVNRVREKKNLLLDSSTLSYSEKDKLKTEPPLSSTPHSGRLLEGAPTEKLGQEKPVSQGEEKPMSKAYIKTILMIAEGKIDPRAPEDPAFMSVLAAIDDDEWSEELRVLDPWRRRPVEGGER